MDIYEVRRTALRRIIKDRYDGVVEHFAEAAGLKPPQVHRWLSTTTKDPRRITETSARKIEAKLKLDPGELDRDEHDGHLGEPKGKTYGSPEHRRLLRLFDELLPEQRKALLEKLESEARIARTLRGLEASQSPLAKKARRDESHGGRSHIGRTTAAHNGGIVVYPDISHWLGRRS